MKWVSFGAIAACPVAFIFGRYWKSRFPYRIPIGWWPFAASILLVLATALITVSYQAIRAARSNPIDSLKYE